MPRAVADRLTYERLRTGSACVTYAGLLPPDSACANPEAKGCILNGRHVWRCSPET